MSAARAVILAAGTSSRMGRQKLLMEYGDRKLIEYAIAAAQDWHPVAVCGSQVEQYLRGRSDVEVVLNDRPELGMSHSLALGNRLVPEDFQLIVLLGDKPLTTANLIRSVVENARHADFVYPEHEGVPGHPVVLSPRARRLIEALPPGDTLRLLREHSGLIVSAIPTSEAGAFHDIDRAE